MITRLAAFISVRRVALVRVLALLAAGCMILSAYLFRPQGEALKHYRPTPGPQDYFDPFAPWLLGAGALLLLAALTLARIEASRPGWVSKPTPTEHSPEKSRSLNALYPRWVWVLAGPGVLLIWIMAEANGEVIVLLDRIWRMSPDMQFALLIGGIALLVVGLGGIPRVLHRRGRSEIRREERRVADKREKTSSDRAQPDSPSPKTERGAGGEVLLVLLLTLAALIVRFWNLGDDVTVMVDEGHFALGITYFWRFPDVNLLEPMPTSASFPFIFSYGQTFLVDVFGRDFQGLRAFSALLGALTIPATYGLARELFTRRVALMAAILL
ncbi:MAG: glycosyltransferase family 39 protein, partial [Anaerolineae bacterium]|nr:glycosyltransferase family 39 protein [Anaerolineae bacterium]